jgi:pimeloyl-ACP methyl ester carboxylesterase
VSDIHKWWQAGERIPLTLGGSKRMIFVRRVGSGDSMTLLHGFPSSSHDWAKVASELSGTRSLLMPDLLGFGASDKPEDHNYSILEQADLVEALWEREGISHTVILAHDYSVTVAQELLARRAEGSLRVDLAALTLLNGGLYPDLHRPQPVQTALADPEQGPQISAAMNEQLWAQALQPTFGPGFDGTADAAEMWPAVTRGGVVLHRLIAYMEERRQRAERWVGALEQTDVPLSFVWGMLDPISGSQIAQRIRERLPAAPLTALEDVGHWPMLEAPERVVAAL